MQEKIIVPKLKIVYGSLMHEIMDFSEMISEDPHAEGYNLYRIEFPYKNIGMTISAKKSLHSREWLIRTWTTYNV